MRNLPKGLPEIPQVPGYIPIGQAMNFEYFPIVSGKEVVVPLPFTNTQITNGTECFMVIRKNDSCDIVLPTSVHPGYLTVTVDSTVKSVILVQKGMNHGSAVAYLDGGMIYSHDNGTSIRTNIVLRNCLPGYVDSALMKVYYTDISDPFNPVNDSVLFPFDTVKVAEGYLLETRDMVRFAGAVRVNKITLDIPNFYISYMDSTTHNVSRGQSLVFNCDWDIDYFSSIPKPVSASYDINYALESVSIDGDGRILQHRTGDSVTYSYDFYLKDHLGSTRMVFNDQQSVTEKINYQSYGTINPLDSSSPALPSREKFTGKEYDIQGADFARVEFDISVSDFEMGSGSGFLRVAYKDVATGKYFTKIYKTRYDSINRALRFTGSESFTGEIEILHMELLASGSNGTIFNTVGIDSFVVNPGKTRKIQLNVPSDEIVGAPIDTNLYSILAAVDNTSYFSGTRLYYFGARYYDPELGIWLSVDPAEEYWNSYLYCGADPNNYIDPFGLWTFGLGLLFGYTKEGGFSLGFGITGDFGQGAGNLSWQYNFGNDSHTFSAGVGGQGDYVHGNAGYTYNTESGHAINASAGGQYYCFGGESVFQTSWDTDGNYLGGSFGQRGFIGASGFNIGGGYQWAWGQYKEGWFGDFDAAGFSGRWDKSGFSWSAQQNVQMASYTSENDQNYANLYTEKSDKIGHSAIVGMYGGNAFQISFGPTGTANSMLKYLFGFKGGTNDWNTHTEDGKMTPLKGANVRALYDYSRFLQLATKLKIIPYNALISSCSFHAGIALTIAGRFGLGGSIHPFALEKQIQFGGFHF